MSVKLPPTEKAGAEGRSVPKPPPLPTPMPPPLPAVVPEVLEAVPENSAVVLGGRPDRCPRCQGQLVSPESLGWCQKCGYCRSLEEDKARVRLERPARLLRPVPSRLEVLFLIARLPGWVWVLTAGVLIIVAVTYPFSRWVEQDSLERAIWCIAQLGAGLLLLWATQFWTLLLVADKDPRLNAFDIFLTGRLWGVAAGELPKTCLQFCLAAWAITLMLTSLFMIGGIDHMLRYLPRSSTLPM
jgi:hypothetical protein